MMGLSLPAGGMAKRVWDCSGRRTAWC